MQISVKNLEFAFENRPLFQKLNMEIGSAQITLIRGPSGCGKSTFLRLVAGLLPLQSGEIQFHPHNFRNIGYQHQDCHLIDHWTLKENLALVSQDLDAQNLWLKKMGLSMSLSSLVSSLSGGERQRISLIKLFLQKPDLALLDEPTAHLDDEHTQIVMDCIRSELAGKTVILVSHDQRIQSCAHVVLNWRKEIFL